MRHLAVFALLLAAPPAGAAPAPDAPALQVSGAGVRAAPFRLADLEAMKPVEATWTAAGGARAVVGVPLDKLLERQGLVPGRMGDDGSEHGKGWRRVVVASAPDGFQAVFTVAELTAHLGPTRALVAWKLDGKPLPPDRGPLRLVVLTDKIASRSVHSVNRLEVVELGQPAAQAGKHGGHGGGRPEPSPTGSPGKMDGHGHGAAAASVQAGAHAGALDKLSDIHGAAGPFVVAGYRMGQRALRELGLPAGSFDLEVRHQSPAEVQWSCIADGAQAATGASAGKLNLSLEKAAREKTRTVFRRRSNGKSVAFTLQPAFVKRFLDLPRDQLLRAGSEVMGLGDEQIFALERP
jgi:DMSO/TMAO reductase YedYZ molybdopterin-dependent catalytic subunit